MGPKPIQVDCGDMQSLSSVLGGRAKDLNDVSGWISGQALLSHPKISGGQSRVQTVWSKAVALLHQDMSLTSGKVDKSVEVYEKNDKTVKLAYDKQCKAGEH